MPIFAQMIDSISTSASSVATTPTLANVSLAAIDPRLTNILIGLFLVVSITMILLVLIQRPQGGGLSGAFGAGGDSGGAGQTAFGTKTGDVLTWATIGIFVLFLAFAIVLNFATRPQNISSSTPVFTAPAGQADPVDLPVDSPIDALGEATDLSGNPDDVISDVVDEIVDDAPSTDLPAGDE